jgi:hypothetical protein
MNDFLVLQLRRDRVAEEKRHRHWCSDMAIAKRPQLRLRRSNEGTSVEFPWFCDVPDFNNDEVPPGSRHAVFDARYDFYRVSGKVRCSAMPQSSALCDRPRARTIGIAKLTIRIFVIFVCFIGRRESRMLCLAGGKNWFGVVCIRRRVRFSRASIGKV